MDKERIWSHIHAERAALATTLAGLDLAQWEHASLCPGWRVQDVAAHVISNPQIGWRHLPGMFGRHLGRSYNTMILREVQRLGATETPASILEDFDRYADSRRHVPITTTVEPLVDVLLHHQDVVRPLGLHREMAPEAAAVAADRMRLLAPLSGTRRLVRSVRFEATDVAWTRGSGPVLRGPIQELLMAISGRQPDRSLLEGDGLAALTSTA